MTFQRSFYYTLFAAVSILLVTIIACEREVPTGQNLEIEEAEELVRHYNATVVVEALKGFNATGTVSTNITENGEVFLINFNSPDLGKFRSFKLYVEQPISFLKEMPKHIENAQIVYLGDHLLISDLDTPFRSYFYLKDKGLDIIEQLELNIHQPLTGLGSAVVGKDKVSFRNMGEEDNCRCKPIRNSFSPEQECTAGGPGSTSCSISCSSDGSSCSVSVSTGYYACCYCVQ